jgi:hypothetical protein
MALSAVAFAIIRLPPKPGGKQPKLVGHNFLLLAC